MRKLRLFLLLIPLLMSSLNLFAWNNGDTFVDDNCIYRVVSPTGPLHTVELVSSSKANLVIPSTIQKEDVQFTVIGISSLYPSPDYTGVLSVTIPEGIQYIRSYAFRNSSLTTLNVPASVSEFYISEHLPATLQNITVASGNPYFESYNGVLYTKGKKTLLCCPRNTSTLSSTNGTFTVPDGVETLGAKCFTGVTNLKTLHISQSVKNIDKTVDVSIFYTTLVTAITVASNNPYFTSNDGVLLTKDQKTLVLYPRAKNSGGSYTVPSTVTKIDTLAFNVAQLKSLNLSNVQEICQYGLRAATITSLNIPASLKKIGLNFGIACHNVETITVASGNTNFKIMNNALYSYDGKRLLKYPCKATATSYSIASGTEIIDTLAFYNCPNLKIITIPASVTAIHNSAFYYSQNLSTVRFASGSKLKYIERSSFRDTSIERLDFPASLEEMKEASLGNASSLKIVTIAAGSQLRKIGKHCTSNSPNLESFTFEDPNSSVLQMIGLWAFRDTKLKSFTLPSTIQNIGELAFNGCTQLATVNFPADNVSVLDTIHGGAFANTAFTLTRIPSSVRCIGREAFWNVKCSPTIAISSRTDSISPEAFKGCYNLKSLQVDKANTKYSSIDDMLLTKDKETLVLFPPGKANDKFTLLAPSIRKIGDYAFYQNDNLTNVVIPNRVTSLGKRAFGLCPNLNTMTLLCENFLDPANIQQLLNEATFDDGNTTSDDYRKYIDLHVRKELLAQYENEPFYDIYFKSINPSFSPMKNPGKPTDGLNDLEEYIAVSAAAVSLLSANSTDETYVVPRKVYKNRLDDYTVAMIGDYAFQGCNAGIKEVVVPGEVTYVGAKSFLSDTTNVATSTIKSIFLLAGAQDAETFSTVRFELDDTGKDYSEFASDAKVYVKKSTFNSADFQNAVKRYTEGSSVHPRTRNMFNYQIPGISIKKSYGTFAREFDVDLSEYAKELEEQYGTGAGGRVFAFAAPRDEPGSYFKPGGGDNPDSEGTYYVRMTSLEHTLKDGTKTDGTYIPAETGVLLKSWDNLAQTDDGFFYSIGEDGMADAPATSYLVGVTRKATSVSGSNIFIMSGGVFKPLGGQTIAEFPIHKAYLQLEGFPGATSGAKVMFLFNDDPVPTEIDAFGMDEGMGMKDESPVYDLQGRLVAAPSKGIYVRNGKKVIIK